jgi:hypothetical protein
VIDPADPEPVEKLKRRLMIAAKVNNAPDALRLAYRIEGVDLPDGIKSSRVAFVDMDGVQDSVQRWNIEDAEAWLREKLAAGPVDSKDLASIPPGTLSRVAKRLNIVKTPIPGTRRLLWSLEE